MNSALLRNTIDIYELVETKTQYGTIKKDYQHKCQARTHVIFNSENQVISEGEVYYPINRTFIVRAFIPVKETDVIEFEGKRYKIMSINKNIYYNDIEIVATLINK